MGTWSHGGSVHIGLLILSNQHNGTYWIVHIMVYGIMLLYGMIWYYGIMVSYGIIWYYDIMVFLLLYKLFASRGLRFAGIHFHNLCLEK